LLDIKIGIESTNPIAAVNYRSVVHSFVNFVFGSTGTAKYTTILTTKLAEHVQ